MNNCIFVKLIVYLKICFRKLLSFKNSVFFYLGLDFSIFQNLSRHFFPGFFDFQIRLIFYRFFEKLKTQSRLTIYISQQLLSILKNACSPESAPLIFK